jgi:hypothetical protein
MGCKCKDLGLPVGPAGEDGKGYDAISVTSLDVLDTAATTIQATISPDKAYSPSAPYRFGDASNPTVNYFEGICTFYDPSTGLFEGTVTVKNGSGTINSWNVNLVGEPGSAGAVGAAGAAGATGPTGPTGPTGAAGQAQLILSSSYTNNTHGGGAATSEILDSFTVPASYPAQNGNILEIESQFIVSSASGANYVRININGTNVITRTDLSVTSIVNMKLTAIRSGATTLRVFGVANASGTTTANSTTVLITDVTVNYAAGFNIDAIGYDSPGGSTINCYGLVVKTITAL